MKNYRLTQALGGISDDLLLEAAEVKKKRRLKGSLLRIAAVAAIIAILLTALFWPVDENYVSGPGLFVVRAYAVDENSGIPVEGVVLEEGVEFLPGLRFNPAQSYTQYAPFAFSVDETQYAGMDITLEVETNAGIFYKKAPFDSSLLEMTPTEQLLTRYYGQHFDVAVDKTLYWDPWGFDYTYMEQQYERGVQILDQTYRPYYMESNPSYIDVIFRADGKIIGYCVIEIQLLDGELFEIQEFAFELLAMVSFPKIEGRWQKVTEEYVRSQISIIHNEREGRL